MKIAYGVHGYGRGHAMRAKAILPELLKRNDVLVFAGDEAAHSLRDEFRTILIPTLKYVYRKGGVISHLRTARRNCSAILDLKLGGPTIDMVKHEIQQFGAQIIIYDCEAYVAQAAQALHIPAISFDNFGVLSHCRIELPWRDRISRRVQCAVYRHLYGIPQRAVISSFFDPDPVDSRAVFVGPVMRPEVLATPRIDGDHLLVYMSQGDAEYTQALDEALQSCGLDVRIYGTSRCDTVGNLHFMPYGNIPFLNDLASCRAVVATTGNQMLTEILHFRKPVFAMPIQCLEQRVNAAQVARMGIGQIANAKRTTPSELRGFLSQLGEFQRRFPPALRNGAQAAVGAIERFAAELVPASTT